MVNNTVPDMEKIRLATVGVGRFGIYHLHAFKQLQKLLNVELVAAADCDECKHDLIKSQFNIPVYTDYLEMIAEEKIDGISVATQDHLHKDIVINSLLNDIHVLVEKPLHTCAEGSAEMVKVAAERNMLLQVDFHKRYDPYHKEIKQLISENKFGEFLYGYCHMEDQIVVPRDWFKEWVHYSSPVWFLGSNMIDLMSWMMSSKVKTVYAKGQKNKLAGMGVNTYDSVQSMLTYENNAVITVDSSWILPEQFSAIVNQGFRLVGTEGIIEADSHNRGTTSCFTGEAGIRNLNSGFMQTVKDMNGEDIYEGYGIQSIQHFVYNMILLKNGRSLQDLDSTYPSGAEALEVTKTIEAIHESVASGEVIKLDRESKYEEKL